MSLIFKADTIQIQSIKFKITPMNFETTSNQFKKPQTFDPKIRPTTTPSPNRQNKSYSSWGGGVNISKYKIDLKNTRTVSKAFSRF